MPGFVSHTGKIVVYNVDDVDTDRIIPARFLTRVSRIGYGDLLFNDVRVEGFPLDAPDAKGATVLVVGKNFGCGSSREHAVWAIQQAGYVAVIAREPGYSDIFRQNSANCGLLLIELAPAAHGALANAGTGAEAKIDLGAQTVSVADDAFRFEIDPASKAQITAGLDLIGTTLELDDTIANFESKWHSFAPHPDTKTATNASN